METDIVVKIQKLKNDFDNWFLVQTIDVAGLDNKGLLRLACDAKGNIYFMFCKSSYVYKWDVRAQEVNLFYDFSHYSDRCLDKSWIGFLAVDKKRDSVAVIDINNRALVSIPCNRSHKPKIYFFPEIPTQSILQNLCFHDDDLYVCERSASSLIFHRFDEHLNRLGEKAYDWQDDNMLGDLCFDASKGVFYQAVPKKGIVFRIAEDTTGILYESTAERPFGVILHDGAFYLPITQSPACNLIKMDASDDIVYSCFLPEVQMPCAITLFDERLIVADRHGKKILVYEKS